MTVPIAADCDSGPRGKAFSPPVSQMLRAAVLIGDGWGGICERQAMPSPPRSGSPQGLILRADPGRRTGRALLSPSLLHSGTRLGRSGRHPEE